MVTNTPLYHTTFDGSTYFHIRFYVIPNHQSVVEMDKTLRIRRLPCSKLAATNLNFNFNILINDAHDAMYYYYYCHIQHTTETRSVSFFFGLRVLLSRCSKAMRIIQPRIWEMIRRAGLYKRIWRGSLGPLVEIVNININVIL